MNRRTLALFAAVCLSFGARAHAADIGDRESVERIVDHAVRPMMTESGIPGVAVGISVGGKRHIFCYGVADRESGREITDNTIFEIGSVSKTFTATLASYAQVQGKLSLSDHASKYLPALGGTAFDHISLLELATFTAGGLPLQFPDAITNDAQMIAFYRSWRPKYPPGTHRLYSNPSIGLFGYVSARSMGAPFDNLMEGQLLPALGLSHTFINVPVAEIANYAFGYTKDNKRIRVAPGVFDAEAYGVKSTAGDMLRFVEANMDGRHIEPTLRRAILATHVGYYQVGPMAQGLGWELVQYPTTLDRLLSANSSDMAFRPHEVSALIPSATPRTDILINKTGSTNGFGAYVAFVPSKKVGIVVLANKNFPIPARVRAAYAILSALEMGEPSKRSAG